MILTRDELRGWSALELATLAVWNEEKGGATARHANLAIEELERRSVERDRYRDALREIATRPKVERNPDGVDQAAWTMALIAQEALDGKSA